MCLRSIDDLQTLAEKKANTTRTDIAAPVFMDEPSKLPSGVFHPDVGVSTAILFITKTSGGTVIGSTRGPRCGAEGAHAAHQRPWTVGVTPRT